MSFTTKKTNEASQILFKAALLLSFLAIELVLFLHTRRAKFLGLIPQPSCESGLVYVYNLPPQFNIDLVNACDSIFPWTSLCPLNNSGFGPAASLDSEFSALVPSSLLQSWFSTNQFALELIIHQRILNHQCRTFNRYQASAFYIPFYAGLAISTHLWPLNSSTALDRDRDSLQVLEWLEKQEPYQRSRGWDHFITLGRITWDFHRTTDAGWGSSFLNMPEMKNMTRFLIELDPNDEMDVAIPYPTGFHPKFVAEIQEWQDFVLNRERSTLVGYAGAPRAGSTNDFRGLLNAECIKAGSKCRTVDCGGGKCYISNAEPMELLLDSEFCLQPAGDSSTRKSLFDCMLAGSIPVLFWKESAYLQYKWHLVKGEETEWSVFVDSKDVTEKNVSIMAVLENIGQETTRKMREKVVEMIPRLIYAAEELGDEMDDAFDIALQGVLKQVNDRRLSLQLGISN